MNGRRIVPKGTPGATAHNITRDVPVSIISRAEGPPEVVQHDAEPCYGCACCVVWSVQLDALARSMRAHDDTHDAAACLVCQLLAGATA